MADKKLVENGKDRTDLFIRHFSFWPHLTDAQKDLLSQHTRTVHYAKGEAVHRGTFDCIGVMLVKTGQLRIYTLSEDGRDVTLHRLFPGDIGIMSATCVFPAVTFDVYIDAVEDTEILLTDAQTFKRLSDENIYVKEFGYETAASRLSEMLWRMQQILFLSADRRLAVFLLEERAKTKSDDIRLTHEQIAQFMGSAREVVSRLMKYFNQEGYVRSGRGRLRILDPEGLKELAGDAARIPE